MLELYSILKNIFFIIIIAIFINIIYKIFIKKEKIFYNNCDNYEIGIIINKVLNNNELNFYIQLKKAIEGKNYLIFSKVRIADFLRIDDNLNYKEKISFFNKIKSKHIDFIITDLESNIKYLIELDGYSHKYNKRTIENDIFKNELFKELDLKLIRFKNQKNYNFEILKL